MVYGANALMTCTSANSTVETCTPPPTEFALGLALHSLAMAINTIQRLLYLVELEHPRIRMPKVHLEYNA